MKRHHGPLIIDPEDDPHPGTKCVAWTLAFSLVGIFGGELIILINIIRAIAHYWGA